MCDRIVDIVQCQNSNEKWILMSKSSVQKDVIIKMWIRTERLLFSDIIFERSMLNKYAIIADVRQQTIDYKIILAAP